MSYDVRSIDEFDRSFKRLAKKYPSLRNDLAELIDQLRLTPQLGVALGGGIYKVRLKIASKGKGKSGDDA